MRILDTADWHRRPPVFQDVRRLAGGGPRHAS